MKTKIRITNGSESSPVLTVSHYSTASLKKFIEHFKDQCADIVNPKQAMIQFIVGAATSKQIYNVTPLSISEDISNGIKDNSNVEFVSLRKPNIVEFVYQKDNGETDWRKIDMIEDKADYIKGFDINDDNKFKCFKKKLIVGNRVLKTV